MADDLGAAPRVAGSGVVPRTSGLRSVPADRDDHSGEHQHHAQQLEGGRPLAQEREAECHRSGRLDEQQRADHPRGQLRPWLTDHGGGWGWHLHVTAHDAALEHRIAAQVGFAVADLVRLRETGRLRHGEAPGCDAVFVDLSKNRSRRYCDTGNCGNRQHVAAYRERRAARAGQDG
jgi:hypothetical protein